MKLFVLALILVTPSADIGSQVNHKATSQPEPSWECVRNCWVPFTYLMSQKYLLVGKELIVTGWARRIDRRLYFFPDQDRAIEGVYPESVHLVPDPSIVSEMAGVDLRRIEVKGYVIYDSRPMSDAWMRFRVTGWDNPRVRPGQGSANPTHNEGAK